MANVPSNLKKSKDWIKDETLTDAQISPTANIASSKLAAFEENRDAGGYRVVNAADAVDAQDLVTLQQLNATVTASAAGLTIKKPVLAASTGNIAGTYANTGGSSGRGQFTGMPNAVDGVSLSNGDRVLLKNQSTGAQNGIYVVTTVGSGSNGVWDRATDFDEDSEVVDGSYVFVGQGTTNSNSAWVLTTNNPITIGGASGTSLTWEQFGGGSTYIADETTLTLNVNEFSIKNGGVDTAQLASDAVDGTKIADDSIDSEHYVDASIDSNHLSDGSVIRDKIDADAVDGTKIADDAVDTEHIADEAVSTPALAIHEQIITSGKDGSTSAFTLSTPIYQKGSEVIWAGNKLFPTVGGTPGQYTITGATGGGTTLTLLDSAAPESDEFLAVRGFKIV